MESSSTKIFCLCLILMGIKSQSIEPSTLTRTIDTLFQNYDRRVAPYSEDGTLNVTASVLVLDVFNVDSTKHEFTVNMFLRQQWLDSRLKYSRVQGINSITLDAFYAQRIWSPDTFILNERSAYRHELQSAQEYCRILPNGRVLKSSRLSVTASCRMSLGYFPFDRQVCALEFGSYINIGPGYKFAWILPNAGASVRGDLSSSSLNFRFTGLQTKTRTIVYPSANQTILGIEFYFARHSVRYIQDVFLPTVMLGILACYTLYLRSNLVRLQLSSLLMVITLVFMNVNANWMPKVSYQTALDIYLFLSAFFIFLIVLVTFYDFNEDKRSTHPTKETINMQALRQSKSENSIDYDHNNDPGEPLCGTNERAHYVGVKVADITKIIACIFAKYLPLSYLCFNIIFWVVVLIGSCWYPQGLSELETRE